MIPRSRFTGGAIRLDGQRKRVVEAGRRRLLVTGAILCTAFAVIAVRLVGVTVLQAGVEPRDRPSATLSRGAAARAEITDRNGVVLAANLATATLIADARRVPEPERTAVALSRVLPDLDRAAIAAKLRTGRRFIVLRRHLTPREQHAVNRLGVPGLEFSRDQRRVYPAGALTAHAVGFSDPDGRGLAGIEHRFDRDLRVRGTPLALSLDIRIQHVLRAALAEAMDRHSATGAAGLILDVATGELIAIGSLPDFDPHRAARASAAQRFNRATLGIYEMGSTLKIFTFALALEAGTVTLSDGFDATRPIRAARHWIRDFHPQARWLTVPEIFVHSSNIGSAKMALAVGGLRQRAFLDKLGLLRPVALEIGEIGRPLYPRRWRDINTMTIAYGHGLAVSPLQLAAGVAAVVNGGLMQRPTLLRDGNRGKAKARRVLSPATSEKLRRLLRLAVVEGTGKRADASGYLVGGKTGTAEQVTAGRYERKRLLASFVAAFPMHQPRYVVLAVIEQPQGTAETHGYATGGWVAAPAVGRIIARVGPLLGIAPVDEDSHDIERRMRLDLVSAPGERTRLAAH